MRLTKSHKEAFVRSVMNDVPTHKYSDDIEKLVWPKEAVAA